MKKLLFRLAIALTVVLVLLGGTWWAWREWWSEDQLRTAVLKSDVSAVKTLLPLGADASLLFREPGKSVDFLVMSEAPVVVRLIKSGVDPNRRFGSYRFRLDYHKRSEEYRNFTLLMLAAAIGKHAAVKSLLEAGGDVHAVDADGNTALHLAKISDEIAAWGLSTKKTVQLLLEAGADLTTKNADGKTPLDIWPALAEIVEEVEAEKAGP